jgi:transcriptional regulator with XRE-family HTH domain
MAAQNLGEKLRKYREMNNVSRQRLAELSGLGQEFLRSLEEEDLHPSLGPLLKISRALGTRLGTFLDDETGSDPFITRAEERKEDMRALRGDADSLPLRFYSLGRGKTDRHMEPFYIQVLPGDAHNELPSSHEGEEFLVVLSGRIRMVHGEETYELGPGDSIYYNSALPHSVTCKGENAAEIYAVLYLPQ